MSTMTAMNKTSKTLVVIALTCLLLSGCGTGTTWLDIGLDAVTQATPRYKPDAVRPPHLRKPKRRYPPRVVRGLKNMALYKPVTSSTKPTIGELEQVTDGIKTSGRFDIVEGPKWVQVDLKAPVSIHAIAVWHFYKNPIIYDDVIVEIADDAEFSRNVRVLFNNDHDNSSGRGKGKDTAYISRWWGEVVDARDPDRAGIIARFVRLYTRKSADGARPRYVEVAVYGKKADKKKE